MEIDEEQMACLQCGHIAEINDSYFSEEMGDTEYPICPKCGEWNIGGYSSFALWDVWPEDERKIIKTLTSASLRS